MTIHSAKGLEFDNVFFAAVEDNIIHQRTIEEDEYKLEGEACFYVALIGARESLVITMASNGKAR